MNDLERNYYNAFVNVRNFDAENAANFPANLAGTVNFAMVSAAASAIQGSGATRQMPRQKKLVIVELREDLQAINRTARALTVNNESIGALFRMSIGNNEQNLLAAARAFLTNVAPLKDQFVEFGLPANFLEDLEAVIAAFEQAVSEKGIATGEQVAATASIDAAVKKGLGALRRLRAIVPNVYLNNPAKLAAWSTTSHVERTGKDKVPSLPKIE